MNDGKCVGAGVIIRRCGKLLALKAPVHMRLPNRGLWDIPKGMIDPGEDPLMCAIRECHEEAGVLPSKIIDGPMIEGNLWIWVVETNGTPSIRENPITRIAEHVEVAWLDPEELEKNCYTYLRPFIVWARDILSKRG